eukprot:5658660-Amphidinium_carterae.1
MSKRLRHSSEYTTTLSNIPSQDRQYHTELSGYFSLPNVLTACKLVTSASISLILTTNAYREAAPITQHRPPLFKPWHDASRNHV